MLRAIRPVLVVLVIFSGSMATPSVSSAQSAPTAAPDILSALLGEVRALRLAMEQMGTAGARVQLALGRLQIQEQRVTETSRRLDETRKGAMGMKEQLDNFAVESKVMEDALVQAALSDPNAQNGMHVAIRAAKARYPQMLAEMQRLQTEEATLAQDLANEQGRLAQLNQQLDEIERSLGRRQP